MQIKTSKTEICNPEPNETAILHKTGLKLQSCAISIRQSRILFFFPIENFKASVQFKLIYFIQLKDNFLQFFYLTV